MSLTNPDFVFQFVQLLGSGIVDCVDLRGYDFKKGKEIERENISCEDLNI